MAAALCASAVFTACSSEMAESVQTVANPEEGYPISIQATKPALDDVTRALSLNGDETVLSATWGAGEKVYVYKYTAATETEGNDALCELQPSTTGSAGTTLQGVIPGTGFSTNDKLVLYYLKQKGADYTGQKGDINDIATNFDFCKATVDITKVSANGIILATGSATFERQQSITRFMLYLGEGTTTEALASSLKVRAAGLLGDDGSEGTDLTITPDVATSKYFIALRNTTGAQDYTFTATIAGLEYTVTKAGVNLPLNKFLGSGLNFKRDLTSAAVIVVNDLKQNDALDGSNVSVTDGGNPLVQGTDYDVTYQKNGVDVDNTSTAGDDYTAVITFKGKYTGTKTSDQFSVTDLPVAVITVPTGKDGMVIAMGDNSQTVGATASYGTTPTDITNQITYSATDGADGGSITIDSSTGAITPVTAGTVLITMTVAESAGNYKGATKTITIYIQQNGMGGNIENPTNAPAMWE